MAYDEELAQRIRERLSSLRDVEEKKMMGGLTFMVKGKMCVGVIKDEMLCRIDPVLHDECVAKPGVRTMIFTKRPMSGFIQVSQEVMRTNSEMDRWIALALAYNEHAKASAKKRRPKGGG